MSASPEKKKEAEAFKVKGNEFFKQGQFEKALEEYKAGLKCDPECIAIYSNRSAVWIKLKEIDFALNDCKKCFELDPNFIKAYVRMGTCHMILEDYDRALITYKEGLEIDPENKDLL